MEATYGKADSGDNVTTANGTWLRDVEKDASAAAAKYFLLIAYPIVFVFGVCGNTLVITVILKFVLPRLLFRCCGRLLRMSDNRIPKRLLSSGHLDSAKRLKVVKRKRDTRRLAIANRSRVGILLVRPYVMGSQKFRRSA